MVPHEYVVLVDEMDHEVGVMEKQLAHTSASLHRAFSVFIFNASGQLLLQKRAEHKYHSGGLWTNTCCSHPRLKEPIETAAHRRLKEEMGIVCELQRKFSFIYHSPFENGLSEHELDHVFTGTFDGEPIINPEEVASYKWIDMQTLREDIVANPEAYTTWFRIILNEYLAHLPS